MVRDQRLPFDLDSDSAVAPLLTKDESTGEIQRSRRRRWRPELLALAVIAVGLLAVHLVFVLLLRKTTYELQRLTIPDMCHAHSQGGIIVRFNNPSYCSPQIGHVQLTVSNNATELLHLALPAFELLAGNSTLVSTLALNLLASPETIHELVFLHDGNYSIAGDVVVHISCLLIPFSITLDLSHLTAQEKKNPSSHLHGFDGDMIRHELDRLVSQILKTIALSHIHTESDKAVLFAYTDVSFTYDATVVWNIPPLAMKLQTDYNATILQAGFKRFMLGDGPTFISSFSEIYRNETEPLQDMLRTFLSGTDVELHVGGSNANSSCLSLQLLDLIDVPVRVPAKIDGQPALLRHYAIAPVLKELDSKTRTCLLLLDVTLTLNNPLPIRFELFELSFDLLYRDHNTTTSQPTMLKRVDDRSDVVWRAHEVHTVALAAEIREFEVCKELLQLYLKDHLALSLRDGTIRMAAGTGNFSIPFHVPEIPIHPSQDAI